MQGAISLHVNDVAPGQPVGLRAGKWEAANRPLRPDEWVAMRSDFALDVAVAGRKPPEAFKPADRSRLTHAGHFLIERPTPDQTLLVHRSRSGDIVTTPIQVDERGHFFIDRWEPLQHERYLYQFHLIEALQLHMGLRPAPCMAASGRGALLSALRWAVRRCLPNASDSGKTPTFWYSTSTP